jgi:hypothetical protein
VFVPVDPHFVRQPGIPVDTALAGIRSVRRSVRTSNGVPLGSLVESRFGLEEQPLYAMERSIADVRGWLAFYKGRKRPPLWGAACPLAARRISSVHVTSASTSLHE